jgi:integrase
MPTVTVKLLLRESKQRSDGQVPVWLRITANRKSRYKSTGIFLEERHWNPERQKVRKSHELAAALNDRLRRLRLEAEHAALDADTAAAVKAELDGSGGTLTAFFEGFITGLHRHEQYWERKKYSTALRKLQATFGRDEIDWNDLDRGALERLERYCMEKCGNNSNTTRKELSRIRRVVRQAMKDGVLRASDDPFLVYDLPKRVSPERHRLTRSEVRTLEQARLDDPDQALARDAFLFSFYGGGVRFGDVCRLRPDHIQGGRLRYRMMKTEQPVDLPLPKAASDIAKRYIDEGPFLFPFLRVGEADDPVRLRRRISSHNARVNLHLKAACKAAGLSSPDKVSFHAARHSFADFARRKSSDLYAVSKALGHSSLQITENYLSEFDQNATDRLANTLWEDDQA